jgi:hypothetical protein
VYAGLDRLPEDSIIQLSDDDIERIAQTAFITDRPLRLRAGRVETTIPAGTTITPPDTFITAILGATLGRRPVHFIMPSPTLALLNLSEFTVRTGVTVRLNDGPVQADGERIVAMPETQLNTLTGRFVDLPRTDALNREVFVYRGVPEGREVWADSATRNIPPNYAWMHAAIAQALEARGEDRTAAMHYARAQRWLELVRLGG